MLRNISIYIIALFVLFACDTNEGTEQQTFSGGTQFKKLSSDETGIDFVNELMEDARGRHNVIKFEYYNNGAGVAVGDINNDGLEDIFFSANEGENRLYLNKGDFKFEDITDGAGINPSNKRWSTGVVMADVNADGWLDIYQCQAGFSLYPREERGNLLYINNGDNTFTEQAAEYGIDDRNESVSAAFFDYDKDGDLDLYVLNESIYVRKYFDFIFEELKDPQKLANASGSLFRNDGNKFVNVTKEAGVERFGFGLGLNVTDINSDGLPDIYVCNDYTVPDFMFINNGDGTFTDKINEKTRQVSYFSMGNDIQDYNNDGLPDIVVVDMAATDHVRGKTMMQSMDVDNFWFLVNNLGFQYAYMFNTLQLNNGNGTFSNVAALAGILKSEWSWAVLLADLDNDGWKDCYITNGYRRYPLENDFQNYMRKEIAKHGTLPLDLRQEIYHKAPVIKVENFVYRNNQDLTFTEQGASWALNDTSFSNGAAYADLDNDGDLDLVVNNIDHEAFVYKNMNREEKGSNFLQFKFKGNEKNPLAYNTKVWLQYGDGEIQYQEFHPTRGYASSVGHVVHFGLGNVEKVDKAIIEWPDGKKHLLTDISVNERLELDQKDAKELDVNMSPEPAPYALEELEASQLGVDFRHKENQFNDFAKEVLMPHKQSTLGPQIAVGDVNKDGLDDFFIGGAQNQSGALYIQQSDGTFQQPESMPWESDRFSEDMDARFLDIDGDDDLDLYVASGGGGEMEENQQDLPDRIYFNESTKDKVIFRIGQKLEPTNGSNNVVVTADMDGDGDLDLFVGGAAEPGRYPFPERSYLLRNDKGSFADVTEEYAPELMNPGSVKDAIWKDIDNNGTVDLVAVGEWMPIMVFTNDGTGHLQNVSKEYGTDEMKGWWYSVSAADLNNDGLEDLIVGNVGENIKFSASKKKPLNLFANDFDNNGITDIVLSKEYKGKLVPTRGKECSSDQMPFIDEKFPTYKEFALAELNDILGEEKLSSSLHLQANTFSSAVLLNKGGSFVSEPLPKMAQIAPVNSIIIEDINSDGHLDLLIAGNMYNTEVETARYDAGNGLILIGNGKGSFDPVPPSRSGFFAPLNVKDMALLNYGDGSKIVIVANNDAAPQFFRFHRSDMIGGN